MIFANRQELIEYREKCIDFSNNHKCKILVCAGAACVVSGSEHIENEFRTLIGDDPDVSLEFKPIDEVYTNTETGICRVGCQGLCKKAPLVQIQKKDRVIQYIKVSRKDCREIYETSVKGDGVVDRLLYEENGVQYENIEDIPFFAKQNRMLLNQVASLDIKSLSYYLSAGGLKGLEKALFEMTPEEVVAEIEESKLRGRGGGGFPTGSKWRQVLENSEDEKYIMCNGDEGDPGAFLDGALMEGAPYKVLEGMMIAGYACGAKEGYIYIRAEYPISMRRLNRAIENLTEAGLLGDNIMGTDFSFRIHTVFGAGAFVCGEESSLVNSIEGKRGTPRLKPPFLTISGYHGKPTIVNNVETFANVPYIIENGADTFKNIGTPACPGTKIFSLSGAVKHAGLVEVPMGTTLRQIVFDIGGGMKEGSTFKAVLVGGPTGRCLTERHLDIPFDFETAAQNNAIVGSGGIIVLDQEINMVHLSRFLMRYSVKESCGKCTPCRIGTTRMLEILERLVRGKGSEEDLEQLKKTADFVLVRAACGLGKSTPLMVQSTLEDFREEYEACLEKNQ